MKNRENGVYKIVIRICMVSGKWIWHKLTFPRSRLSRQWEADCERRASANTRLHEEGSHGWCFYQYRGIFEQPLHQRRRLSSSRICVRRRLHCVPSICMRATLLAECQSSWIQRSSIDGRRKPHYSIGTWRGAIENYAHEYRPSRGPSIFVQFYGVTECRLRHDSMNISENADTPFRRFVRWAFDLLTSMRRTRRRLRTVLLPCWRSPIELMRNVFDKKLGYGNNRGSTATQMVWLNARVRSECHMYEYGKCLEYSTHTIRLLRSIRSTLTAKASVYATLPRFFNGTGNRIDKFGANGIALLQHGAQMVCDNLEANQTDDTAYMTKIVLGLVWSPHYIILQAFERALQDIPREC